MNIKKYLVSKNSINKAEELIEAIVKDEQQKSKLKYEIFKLLMSTHIAKYVRALIALMFVIVWLFLPENIESNQDIAKYLMLGIVSFYFLLDVGIDRIKK
jgi:predicted RND superfamily exporter protein